MDCFKAYDIRGRIPSELNESIAYRIGVAVADYFNASTIVIGYDVRPSSIDIFNALSQGLASRNCKIFNIELCGTEEIYFATNFLNTDAGIMITASHNPSDYNGLKIVGSKAKPISMDSGLDEIMSLTEKAVYVDNNEFVELTKKDIRSDYINKVLSFVDINKINPLKVVFNAGNGCAGPVINDMQKLLPIDCIKINNEPDGSFPSGIPNPLLLENRQVTSDAVIANNADLGIAWDGDFDRCFFFDESGNFVDNYYLIGLLSERLLANHPNSSIVHDPRLVWNTQEEVKKNLGVPMLSKAGHSFIKEVMRENNAIYGGEMSGHHYFRDFYYSDSGMIPWLLLLQSISESGKTLSELVSERVSKFPISGEINTTVANPQQLLETIKNHYQQYDPAIDDLDGYSFDFKTWRFNLRMSNTEPLVRLNVESRENQKLIEEKTKEILGLIDQHK